MTREPFSATLARVAKQQRKRENREALAGWLRLLAERISPDCTYKRIRVRVAMENVLMTFTYTPHDDKSDEPNPVGVRLYVKAAEADMIHRR